MKSDIDSMIIDNMYIVPDVIKKLALTHRYEDFIDIGWIGLVTGAQRYKSEFGVKPTTYLYNYVRGYILAQLNYENQSCRRYKDFIFIPLDKDMKDATIKDFIIGDFNIDSEFNKLCIHEEIKKLLKTLNSDGKKVSHASIVKDYFGINTKKLTTSEITKKYNVSRVTVKNIRDKFRKKLKENLKFILD